MAGLDEDSLHWVGVAIRETVVNAIKHGNRQDAQKLVTVEFAFEPAAAPTRAGDHGHRTRARGSRRRRLPIRWRRRTSSSRAAAASSSCAASWTMWSLTQIPEGGMEVTLVKQLTAPPAAFLPRS